MKRKKIITSFLCVIAIIGLTACGSQPWTEDYSSFVKVGKYKGLEAEAVSVSVSDSELTKEIYSRLKDAATTKDVKSGTVKDGDKVNIDYEGTIDGKKVANATASAQELTIGSGSFIDGFEEGLIGKSIGSEVTLDLTFPNDYNDKDVAGKDVTFKVTINSKKFDVVPELDEEFVKSNSEAKTVAEYRKLVKKELYDAEYKKAEDKQKTELWTEVMESSSVKKQNKEELYPQEQVDRVVKETTKLYEKYAEEYGMKFDEFIESQMSMDRKTFDEQLEIYAKAIVKEEMVIYTIAHKEQIELSSEDVDAYVDELLKSAGYTQESYEKAEGKSYMDAFGKDNVYREAYKDRVLDLILDKAKIK